jgi:hypothetical protein
LWDAQNQNLTMKNKIKLVGILFLVILHSSCIDSDQNTKVVKLLYPERDFNGIYPKLVYYKEIILNESQENSSIYIFRDKNEEMLSIIYNGTIIVRQSYILFNYGAYIYDVRKSEFVPTYLLDTKKPLIINDIAYHKIDGDDYYSLFFTILSEEPPIGLFKVPMIYRNGIKIFDGLNLLKEEDFLRKWKTTSFELKNKNQLFIYSPGNDKKKFLWQDNTFTLLAETK